MGNTKEEEGFFKNENPLIKHIVLVKRKPFTIKMKDIGTFHICEENAVAKGIKYFDIMKDVEFFITRSSDRLSMLERMEYFGKEGIVPLDAHMAMTIFKNVKLLDVLLGRYRDKIRYQDKFTPKEVTFPGSVFIRKSGSKRKHVLSLMIFDPSQPGINSYLKVYEVEDPFRDEPCLVFTKEFITKIKKETS